MNIKKCDRCGEEVRENGGFLNQLVKDIEDVTNFMTGKPIIRLTDRNGKELDLCPTCRAGLIKWMQYGEAIQKAKNNVTPDAIIRDGKRYELKKEEHPEENQEPEQESVDIKFGEF